MKYRITKDGNGWYYPQVKKWWSKWKTVDRGCGTEARAIESIEDHKRIEIQNRLSKQRKVIKEFK